MPLADDLRPRSFDEMTGQTRLVGPNGLLRHLAETKTPRSVIFYGPPGCGKSTAALIYADALDRPLSKLNAVDASVTDIKKIAANAGPNGSVVYLDEIQYFNKKQQQSMLPYLESGTITLIAATTENPYHEVYDALLSRCAIMEFTRPSWQEIASHLTMLAQDPKSPIYELNQEVCDFVAKTCSGDVRRAIGDIEMALAVTTDPKSITIDGIRSIKPSLSMAGFDLNGDSHYAYVSALQKSIRGSDPDAAVFWLAKLLEGGDIIGPARRLLVIACEDIGLAYPDAIVHTLACCEAAERLGLPEAYKPLTQAVLLLATAPKSNSNEPTWQAAQADIRNGLGATVPRHIASEHAPGYIYPHDFPNHWVSQQYLPDDLNGRVYYHAGDNPYEEQAKTHWENVKKTKRKTVTTTRAVPMNMTQEFMPNS